MNTSQAIENLKNMATKSKAANDFFHSCATRERGRGTLTVRAIEQRMLKEGFLHPKQEYEAILGAMAQCGFGKAKLDRNGRVAALEGITAQINSIGRAVIEGVEPKAYATRNKYSPISVPKPLQVIALPKKEALKPSVTKAEEKVQVTKALSGVEDLIRSILGNESIPSDRRIAAAQALLDAR